MSGALPPAVIADDEDLARFILFSSHFHKGDNTVKQDAFIPPGNLEFSVTRHIGISEERLWQIGQQVLDVRSKKPQGPKRLYGRADILTRTVGRHRLQVEARPKEDDPNHALITGWPGDKPAQKILALEMAAEARFHSNPNVSG